jgi:hypothetical protein
MAGDLGGQAGHDPLVLADLDLEPLPAAGELAQGVLGRSQRTRHRPWAEPGAAPDQRDPGQALELLAELRWRDDHESPNPSVHAAPAAQVGRAGYYS